VITTIKHPPVVGISMIILSKELMLYLLPAAQGVNEEEVEEKKKEYCSLKNLK
jgi:hypothetical protein